MEAQNTLSKKFTLVYICFNEIRRRHIFHDHFQASKIESDKGAEGAFIAFIDHCNKYSLCLWSQELLHLNMEHAGNLFVRN